MNALRGVPRPRLLALRLWGPILKTRPDAEPVPEPALEETWKTIARAPAEDPLDSGQGATAGPRGGRHPDLDVDLPLEVIALSGSAATPSTRVRRRTRDLGPGARADRPRCTRVLWLRKVEGLADGTRTLPAPLEGALSTPLLAALVDTTRGTALGEVGTTSAWLGPFAAWWALRRSTGPRCSRSWRSRCR